MEAVVGRAAIRSAAGAMFAALAVSDFKIESQDLQVHGPLAHELAVYSETLTPKGGQPSHVRGRYMIVWRHDPDDRWRVHRNMFHVITQDH
jgi:ketosteroid isomerase-like protein